MDVRIWYDHYWQSDFSALVRIETRLLECRVVAMVQYQCTLWYSCALKDFRKDEPNRWTNSSSRYRTFSCHISLISLNGYLLWRWIDLNSRILLLWRMSILLSIFSFHPKDRRLLSNPRCCWIEDDGGKYSFAMSWCKLSCIGRVYFAPKRNYSTNFYSLLFFAYALCDTMVNHAELLWRNCNRWID